MYPLEVLSMRRDFLGVAVLGVVLLSSVIGLSAQQGTRVVINNEDQANLTWFIAGLKDLCTHKDAKLKLTAAQAKKILPELEALRREKLLVTELPDRQGERRQGGGSGGWQQMSEADRKRMADRQRKTAERIAKALDKMEAALKQDQADYILNMDFNAAQYGVGGFRRPAGERGSFSQAEIEKMRREMQAAMERLVKLNKEVLEMLSKLAK